MTEKLAMQTKDLAQNNIEKIAAAFPNCVTESVDENGKTILAIDFELLKRQLSGSVIAEGKERYVFTWPGKSRAQRLANEPTNNTLRPCRGESIDFDATGNVYIKGDNLDALKLLRETYLGKVKMIYIDPPYNTGNDFVYNDKFTSNLADYNEQSGDYSESGLRFVTNSTANGRFHTDWLNMIYPRIQLAKDFLTEDGAIFISIGDDEQANLVKLCDEIFGEKNFISCICHKARASVSNDRIISENHNYLLFYAKNIDVLFSNHRLIGDDPDLNGFNNSDERGEYKLTPVDGPGGAKKGNPYYEFLGIEGYWRYSKETMQQYYDAGLIVKTKGNLQKKYYKSDAEKSRKTVTTWWDEDFLTSSATTQLIKLMGGKYFDNPKNINLLLRCLKMITKFDKEAIVMDFFSGSCTLGHAVFEFNKQDNGSRKFIAIQLPELIPETSEAYEAGFRTICDVAIKRLNIVSEQIKNEHYQIDSGFRVFKIDSSNMNDVYYNPDSLKKDILDYAAENIKPDRTGEDLLFQVMLELGIELSESIVQEKIDDRIIFSVDGGYLLACFDEKIDETLVTEIANRHPYYAVFRDSSMSSDAVAINFNEIFKTYSPTTKTKVL